jgi:hypothetical protein
MPSKTTDLHPCPHCRTTRTRKPLCVRCTRLAEAKAHKLDRFRRTAGTPLNLGADGFLNALATPAGFTRERCLDTWPGQKSHPALVLAGDGVTIRVVLDGLDDEWSAGTGHTTFTTAKGERTFDRTGVEDSFYLSHDATVASVDAEVASQLQRVAESRARLLRSETVPGLPGAWSVTPERKAEIAAALKAGRRHDFRPAGFGTGYSVGTKPVHRYSGAALPRVTSDFFGVKGTLYYETLDCD